MIFPEVSLKRINDDIKQNTFARVYLLYGPESYLRLFYTDKLCSAVLPESDTMNRALFEGDKTKESDIIDFAETIPFFAEHRAQPAMSRSSLLRRRISFSSGAQIS